MSDSSIIGTADDAIFAKYATSVQTGYYRDPFLAPLMPVRFRQRSSVQIIRRGTHARVMVMDRVIQAFIATRENPKIVVLGSGKDTTFFRYTSGLLDELPASARTTPEAMTTDTPISSTATSSKPAMKRVDWYEVDHPAMIQTKAQKIRQHEDVFESKVTTHPCGGFIVTTNPPHPNNSQCHLISHDLRDAPADLLHKLSQHGLNPLTDNILFVVECVQMYLLETTSQSLLNHLRQMCPHACLVLFDPIVSGGNNNQAASSRFGNMMEQNLLHLGVVTRQSSVLQTRSLSQQLDKLVETCGWTQAVGCDMWWAYYTVVTAAQRQRAKATEELDEVEEWRLIMKHYSLVVACTSDHGIDFCQPGKLLGFDRSKCTVKTKAQQEPAAQDQREDGDEG